MNKKNTNQATDFQDYLDEKLKNEKFKKNFDSYGRQLELAYEISRLRKMKKISQAELAKKIGTTQSNVARFESGQENFTIRFLDKIAVALQSELRIVFK